MLGEAEALREMARLNEQSGCKTEAVTLLTVAQRLSDRDRRIVTTIGDFKLLRADQVERLFFSEQRSLDGAARHCRRSRAVKRKSASRAPVKILSGAWRGLTSCAPRSSTWAHVMKLPPTVARIRLMESRTTAASKPPAQHGWARGHCAPALNGCTHSAKAVKPPASTGWSPPTCLPAP